MKVATSWIRSWLTADISDEQIVAALERAGLEIESFSASQAIHDKVVAALVKDVRPHPGADRLRLATVTTGAAEFAIVCGAPNLREGMIAPLAQIGSVLPDGTEIKAAKLRGEVSEGMLCSPLELGLGDSHEGLLDLASDIEPGTPVASLYPADGIVDVKTHANRFDLLSVVGLAREVAAMTGNKLRDLPNPLRGDSGKAPAVTAEPLASRYMLARIKVSSDATTPDWMAARLRAAGMRPISPIVDITNYVMLDIGQPLHAFDAAKVKLPLSVRFAQNDEKITTLDGVERKLTADDLVIADTTGPIALAGVMGGANTEVSTNTREILLETATFDAGTIRKAAKRHNLRSEASSRMERNLPMQLGPFALSHAVGYFTELAGGELTGLTDVLTKWPWTQRIGLRRSHLEKLLGFPITRKEAVQALAALQFEAQEFDIAAEARSHLGKPYIGGASFKTHGTDAFDCSYLTEYSYSLIGKAIGFTALGQYLLGTPVEVDELTAGDLVFYEGVIINSATDHYYTRDDKGEYTKHVVDPPVRIGHNGMFVGDGKVVTAATYEYKNDEWVKMSDGGGVIEVPVEVFTQNPGYAGARRYAEDLDDFITVPAVPWWRPDVRLAEDLVEEVVRVVGYEKVPSTIPIWRPSYLEFDTKRQHQNRAKNLFSGSGLYEVMTYSFVGEDQLTNAGYKPSKHLKLKNPMSSEQGYLRTDLLPSHLQVLARNRTYAKSVGFYELSRVFIPQKTGKQPLEPTMLAVTVARPADSYRLAKGYFDELARVFGVTLELNPIANKAGYAPNRVATVQLNGSVIGAIGQLDPKHLQAIKLGGEASYFELNFDEIMAHAQTVHFQGMERFPGVTRDIAVIVPRTVRWADVAKALGNLEHATVTFVSDYYGDDIADDKKSLTLHLVLRYPDKTPTEAEANELEERVLSILQRSFSATARN